MYNKYGIYEIRLTPGFLKADNIDLRKSCSRDDISDSLMNSISLISQWGSCRQYYLILNDSYSHNSWFSKFFILSTEYKALNFK